MKKYFTLFSFSCFLFFPVLTAPILAVADDVSEARGFAQKIIDQIEDVINSDKDEASKQQTLINLFEKHVDSDWMGRFVMAANFKKLTQDEKDTFLDVYKDFVVYNYIPRFREYSGEKIIIDDVRQESKKDIVIKTTFETDKSKTGKVSVDFRLRKKNDELKIVDIIGEGISLLSTQRSDFSSAVSMHGPDKFIAMLKKKADYLKKKARE